ncbi:hypothetical protein AN958_02461 [Leucoagaricus sp. SymC.cos]|nr:hypothetical protein AN958_02461 [Leucoagaricus sp. SymC.cos]
MPGLLPAFEVVDCSPRCPPIYCSKKSPAMASLRFTSPPLSSEPRVSLPCTPTPRRRAKAGALSLRRRRQASRVDYRSESTPVHAFDKLPWIASLDVTPNNNANPADLADLSQIPDPTLPHFRPSGPGPIRRRRLSPRSSPLLPHSSLHHPVHTHNSSDDNDTDDDDYPFQRNYNLFARDIPSRPSTPVRKYDFDPTLITFRHLMPVSDPSDDDEV